jgi:hypothetical protein
LRIHPDKGVETVVSDTTSSHEFFLSNTHPELLCAVSILLFLNPQLSSRDIHFEMKLTGPCFTFSLKPGSELNVVPFSGGVHVQINNEKLCIY